MWTSNAHRVHMMILFARTGPRGESRREGVSQFLVDLSLPGITVRPIINLAGEHDFNEVVFDDVFIPDEMRSEEHTSELQSLMRISYAVFCLKKKKKKQE